MTKIFKQKWFWVVPIICIVLIGVYIVNKPYSTVYQLNESLQVYGSSFRLLVTPDPLPIGNDEGFGTATTEDDRYIFSRYPSTIDFEFEFKANPYPIDYVNIWLSPAVSGFDTGYPTNVLELDETDLGQDTIYLRVQAKIPNVSGKFRITMVGSTTSTTYQSGILAIKMELTGSSTDNIMLDSTWVVEERSSTKVVEFKTPEGYNVPVYIEEFAEEIEPTTTTNGNDTTNGNGEDGLLAPSFEFISILSIIFIVIRKKRKREVMSKCPN